MYTVVGQIEKCVRVLVYTVKLYYAVILMVRNCRRGR